MGTGGQTPNKPPVDDKHFALRLMGTGVRFDTSPSILDAICDKLKDMHIHGSAIGILYK